ncbi:hypothetical protein JCM15519_27930 [Fundidesulfovibrio butyratiphilus]
MPGQEPEGVKILALIPARGGSKGIPGKNLADLGGKPLVAHSVLAGVNCRFFDRVVVSTDSPEIAEVARRWGAEVPFLRPAELSHDTASLDDVISHVLQTLKRTENYEPSAMAMLYPTHPFRTRALMDLLVSKLARGYRSVRTVRAMPAGDRSHYVPGAGGGLLPLAGPGELSSRCFFREYGLFSGFWLQPGGLHEFYIHPLRAETELLDIDEPHHLARANELFARWDPEEETPHAP